MTPRAWALAPAPGVVAAALVAAALSVSVGCTVRHSHTREVVLAQRRFVGPPAPGPRVLVLHDESDGRRVRVMAEVDCPLVQEDRVVRLRDEAHSPSWPVVVTGGAVMALALANGVEEGGDAAWAAVGLGGLALVAAPLMLTGTVSDVEAEGVRRRSLGTIPCAAFPRAGARVQSGAGPAAEHGVTDAEGWVRFVAPVAPTALLVDGLPPDAVRVP